MNLVSGNTYVAIRAVMYQRVCVCSCDDSYKQRSLRELLSVIVVAMQLRMRPVSGP